MTDANCLPLCAPNTAGSIPDGQPSVKSRGDDCLLPLHVKICNPSEFDKVILCDPVNGNRIIVVSSYSNAGVPTSVAYNLDGSVYAGAITALVACSSSLESDDVVMCDAGTGINPVATTFLRWVIKDRGEPTGDVFDTTLAGVPYAPVGAVSIGQCNIISTLSGGGVQIAGPVRSATAAFNGAPTTWKTGLLATGTLQSITIMAKATIDGLPTFTADQILVAMPDGTTIALCSGEVRSFAVSRDGANELANTYTVTATGNAYATITYTTT